MHFPHKNRTTSRLAKRVAAAVVLVFSGVIWAATDNADLLRDIPDFSCGELFEPQGVGPCDVRISTDLCPRNPGIPNMLHDVARNHFTHRVEFLEGPEGSFENEIAYMLTVFPNFHRGLFSLARLAQQRHSDKIYHMKYTASCWFVRAVTFAPDDARVREIFGLHLSNFGRKDAALKQFLVAEELGANDANNMYNIGLLYFDKGDYDKALAYAKKAYGAGFQLPGLREKLKKAGKWQG